MAGTRIANPATRVTQSSPSLVSREGTEQPAVVEWNAKRRRLVLRVFNTKTADRQPHEATRGPTPLVHATESSSNSLDRDTQVTDVGPGHSRYQPNSFGPQPRIDTQYGNSEPPFQLNGLESNCKFEPVRTVVDGYDKRHRAGKPTINNAFTKTGGRLEHDSREDAGADLGTPHRAKVIATKPNFQSNDTVDYYAGLRKSYPQRPVHNRKSGRAHDSSAFLLYPGTVSFKRYPTRLNGIHKIKGSVDYLFEDEHLQRKLGVSDPSFLESIIFHPLDGDTSVLNIPDPLPYRTKVLERRAARRRGTMNKFPSKRPSTPENLKRLSAKHYLKTLRGKDAEAELRRHEQTSDIRRRDWSPSEPVVVEEDLIDEDDYTDTRTASTSSSSTVYLIRTVKKPNRYGSNGRTHTKKAEPGSNETAEPHRRKAVPEPVTVQGNADDKDRVQRPRPKKTKRVKNSVTQTSQDILQDDTHVDLTAENTPMPRFITPRKQKRSVGLQTVITEEDLPQQASANPPYIISSRIKPTKTTIAIQTDFPNTSKSTKTTVGTQTMEMETATKTTSVGSLGRKQKEKHDFSGQTESFLTKTTFDEKTSEIEQTIAIPPLRHDEDVPDVSWPAPAIQPRQPHNALITGREEIPPKRKPEEASTVTTNGFTEDHQSQLVYGLQHEVRLLRHENYYLRQQLDYPIKPKGRVQKQNEEKVLQIIRHLESQGSTGKLAPQIREEMMHEAMIENEILRSENSDLQTTLDESRRLHDMLSDENERLRNQVQQQQQQQQKMGMQDVDNDHRQMAPDDYLHHRQTLEADDIDAWRATRPSLPTYRGAVESVAMTTAAPRSQAATRQTRIPKLSSAGELRKLKKPEVRN